MRVLGFDIDETSLRSACGTVRVCKVDSSAWSTKYSWYYHVHVKIGSVRVEGRGETLALAEGRASIEVAKVAEASAKLVAMCPPWPDDFPLCETCQEREAEPDVMWCAGCVQKMREGL